MEQQTNSTRRSRRTRKQIEDLLAEFQKSGSTVKQFSQMHNISPGTFHKWQSRVKSKTLKKAGGPSFTPVVFDPSSRGLFAEVKGIRLYQPVSAEYLKQLLA